MAANPAPSVVLSSGPAVAATPRIPGSKSITNRALLLAAIARGPSTIHGWLDAEDTRWMIRALRALGLRIDGGDDPRAALTLVGAGGPLGADAAEVLQVGTAGTVARFLLAVLAGSPGASTMDGSQRMRERPMGALVAALREQGAAIVSLGDVDPTALPLRVGPHDAPLRGGEIRLARPASSQFVSALAFSALLAAAPTTIVLEHGTPARPYVDMTLAMIRSFGGDARWRDDASIVVTPAVPPSHAGTLVGQDYVVEPDASAASYFLALAAIRGGRCTIDDLGRDSLQGDATFAHVLGRMGARIQQDARTTVLEGDGRLRGGDFDLSDMPDMTLTLAVAALFAEGDTRITGVGVLRHHESDRLAAVATELRKLGATVDLEQDGLVIHPPTARTPGVVAIDTYADHRMAMAFALAGDVEIRDPGCVGKTFPGYFEELAHATGSARDG
ncbi:MAG: 3-phosphoshikimate 1-carboxyvinyltransferase [Myxococcales bacterium]|nr:3-phosphoshikimate 1-carboxyvinyltransferase [Myxococcales bacterium]